MSQLLPAVGFCVLSAASLAPAAEWVRGGDDGRQPRWGIRGALQFSIPPAVRGPRGLVRVLFPTLPGGEYDLINFIAIEPIVNGRRGFSELERSRLDGVNGKRFWVEPDRTRGELTLLDGGTEKLEVTISVEDFDNGARVRLVIEQRSDRPDEIALTLQAQPESAPIEYGILTATMGNKIRARLLWLKDETISSLKLYANHTGDGFAGPVLFPLRHLGRTPGGDLIVAITADETRPADVYPFPGTKRWYYGGLPVTQFWKMRPGAWRDDVGVAVNARHTYWQSQQPIPGGNAFENFELVERYRPGQQFIFGVTRRTPTELGLRGSTSTAPASDR